MATKVFLSDNDDEFEILQDDWELRNFIFQIMQKLSGKSREFCEQTADWFMFNYNLTHFGYEKCDHTFGEYKITLQAIKEN